MYLHHAWKLFFLSGYGQRPNDLDLSTELPWPDEDPGDLEDWCQGRVVCVRTDPESESSLTQLRKSNSRDILNNMTLYYRNKHIVNVTVYYYNRNKHTKINVELYCR